MKITTKKQALTEMARSLKANFYGTKGKTEKHLRQELDAFKNHVVENGGTKVEIGRMFMEFPDAIMALMLDAGLLDSTPYLKDIAESVIGVEMYVSPVLKVHPVDSFKNFNIFKAFGPGMGTDVIMRPQLPKRMGGYFVKNEIVEV
jgi:hypothetical protein